ncbi:membrane protein insertion efficiency factor YidD [Corynebacterium pacaense]|uniref:membrane protein insertion efficiency factor YidD n=1 Tax=Corynebacterium pacaense TaxID=1816684 RepID=UPI003CCBCDFC
MPAARGPAAKALVGSLRFYQKYLSGLKMGSTCRFDPVCSSYALEAVSVHGAFKGTILSAVRLSKCGPWHPGGYDPVPESGFWSTQTVK